MYANHLERGLVENLSDSLIYRCLSGHLCNLCMAENPANGNKNKPMITQYFFFRMCRGRIFLRMKDIV